MLSSDIHSSLGRDLQWLNPRRKRKGKLSLPNLASLDNYPKEKKLREEG